MNGRIEGLEEALKGEVGILPADHAVGTVNGNSIDTKNFNELWVLLLAGLATATGTADVTLEESDDDTNWTAITGAAFAQITTANDNALYNARIDCKNFKRYIRAVAVIGTDTVILGVIYIAGKGDGRMPVTQQNTPSFVLNYVDA